MPLDPTVLKNLKALHRARKGEDYWAWTYPEWSDAQMRFLQSDKKKLLLRAARRAGKSIAVAERILKQVNTPRIINGERITGGFAYIAPTKSDAKAIIWNQLKEMCKRRGLNYTSHEVDLKMTFPNGGFIQLEGAGLNDSADKARGKKLIGVAIDEAAYINVLRELVGIWTPTLADYDGEIILSCSPGKSPSGYFYSCDQGEDSQHWDSYYLLPEDNPAFKGGRYDKFRQEQLNTLYGGNADHPEYRREWLGEWVHDVSNLLIKYDPKRNLYDDIHVKNTDLYDYIIGLDLGFLDSTAISVAAVAKYEPEAIFVDEFTKPEMRISEIIEKVEQYSNKWNASAIVVDSGGFGRHTYEELRNREGLPAVDRAQKYGKKLNIETLNNELYAGRIKVLPECKQTIGAWEKVLKNAKGTEDESVDYGSQGVLDILDASLYAAMELMPSVHQHLQPKESEEEKMRRKRFEKHKKIDNILDRYGMKGFVDET